MGLCVVSHSSRPPAPSPQPSGFSHSFYSGIMICTSKSLSAPHICTLAAACRQLASQFIMSLLEKAAKGQGEAHTIFHYQDPSPALTSCQGVIFIFFYCTFFNKTGRCLETTDPGFRTHVLFLVTYLKSRSCSLSTFGGFFQGPSLYSLIHHCHQLQGKNPLMGDGRQRGDLSPLPVSPSAPYIRKNMNGS